MNTITTNNFSTVVFSITNRCIADGSRVAVHAAEIAGEIASALDNGLAFVVRDLARIECERVTVDAGVEIVDALLDFANAYDGVRGFDCPEYACKYARTVLAHKLS